MPVVPETEFSLKGRAGVTVFLLFAMALYALLHFDKTLMAARQFIASDQKLIDRIGVVEGTTVVKMRWIDDYCFAQYFIYARGQNWRFVKLEVLACGPREKPEFQIKY